MSYGYREPPPPSTNGWGKSLDREVTSIRRELDQCRDLISDHETRLRSLEVHTQNHEHQITHVSDTTDELDSRLAMQERALRMVVWVLAVIGWKISPDIAVQLLALLPVRM